jgi:hypothetical protein
MRNIHSRNLTCIIIVALSAYDDESKSNIPTLPLVRKPSPQKSNISPYRPYHIVWLEHVRHYLIWEVEEDAFIGEVPVEVLPRPREGLIDVFLRPEALHELDHVDVRHVNLWVHH